MRKTQMKKPCGYFQKANNKKKSGEEKREEDEP